MNPPKLVIIADDLTGAADNAARCVHVGLSAEIWFEAVAQASKADVVALSTDSRYLSPAEAARRVSATAAGLAMWAVSIWYKKIDSTLRGNLGAEIDALLAVLPDTVAVISSAFPAQGRGLEDGKLLYADSIPHHLPTLLREQSRLQIGEIGLPIVRRGVRALAEELQRNRHQGKQQIVVDAVSEHDLDVIVEATHKGAYLLCGSAGLVAPLAARWSEKKRATTSANLVEAGPILVLVGSGCDTAHAQVAQVTEVNSMRVRTLGHDWYDLDLIGAQSHPAGDWLIHLEAPGPEVECEGPAARAQAARLADVAQAIVNRLQPSALVVVGGDTAHYVLGRLGIKRLTVEEELLPGIALTFGVDRTGKRRAVVLKPGNFGDSQTLITLQQKLHERQRVVQKSS